MDRGWSNNFNNTIPPPFSFFYTTVPIAYCWEWNDTTRQDVEINDFSHFIYIYIWDVSTV
jgi:hypothetical protein